MRIKNKNFVLLRKNSVFSDKLLSKYSSIKRGAGKEQFSAMALCALLMTSEAAEDGDLLGINAS